jgi:hypothetical protein
MVTGPAPGAALVGAFADDMVVVTKRLTVVRKSLPWKSRDRTRAALVRD